MPIYVYESKDGDRIERVSSWEKSPKTVRANGKRYERIIVQTASPVVENVAGIHRGPGEPVMIRNKHDIRELEARVPGLKYDPSFYHERKYR